MTTFSFHEWLLEEMEARGLSQRELAKLAQISPGAISHVLNQTRKPGPELCLAIARGLKLPPEVVFRKAGLLPAASPDTEYTQHLLHIIRQLPPEDRQDILEYARFRLERRAQRKG